MTNPESSPEQQTVLLFPGQGSQFPAMGKVLKDSPNAWTLMEQADDLLGYSLSGIMMREDGAELQRTIYTQPAIFVYSVALLHGIMERVPLSGRVFMGHSLGEYTALYCAGALTFEDALKLINVRARAMDEAQDSGTCGMAAVICPDRQAVTDIIAEYNDPDSLTVANYNSPEQLVISGRLDAINSVIPKLTSLKRSRVVMLPVSSAFHSPLMKTAREALKSELDTVAVTPPVIPVIANASAEPYPTATAEVKQLLYDQVVTPVLWEQSVQRALQMDGKQFIEIGPGKVLTGLVKRIDKSVACCNICDFDTLMHYPGFVAC